MTVVSILLTRQYVITVPGSDFTKIQRACVVPSLIGIAAIQVMIWLIDDHTSPYWGGLGIILSAISVGFSFSRRYYFYIFSFLVLNFLAYAVAYYFRKQEIIPLLHFAFLASIGIAGGVGRWFYNKLERAEYEARRQLLSEIHNRNEIIQHNTTQLIRLKTLSKQFSPRLVQAIEDGIVDVGGEPMNREICVLFIDIKDSTKKVLSLKGEDARQIFEMFMSDVIKVMIRHDLTIDKFVGDGVIGFTNAPLPQAEFVRKAVEAAFEIQALFKTKAAVYDGIWGSKFEYRMGLALDESSVGFFGSIDTFKTYTGIGPAINLANRVNGVAAANEIVLTEPIRKRLELDKDFYSKLQLSQMPKTPLKGFEEREIILWEVKGPSR